MALYSRRSILLGLVAVCGLVLSVGCGKPASSGGGESTEAFLPAYVSCPSQNCSPAVAMIITSKGEGVGKCTGFLVADDVLATNDHCVEKSLSEHSSCREYVEVFFPQTRGYPQEAIKCASVIWRSGDAKSDNPLIVDTVFLKLNRKVNRPALNFSRVGTLHNQIVQVEKVDPSGELSGNLVSKKCLVNQKSEVFPSYEGRSSLGLVLVEPPGSDCEILSGNSGSPVLDNGNAVGIVHHSNKADAGTWGNLLRAMFGTTPTAVATNFACVPAPYSTDFVAPEECRKSVENMEVARAKLKREKEQEREQNRVSALESLKADLNKAAEEWGNQNYPMFKWKMGAVATGIILKSDQLIPIPYCTQNQGLGDAKYKSNWWGLKNSFDTTEILPVFRYQLESNENGRIKFRVQQSYNYITVNFGFSPDSISKGKISYLTVESPQTFLKDINIHDRLAPCK